MGPDGVLVAQQPVQEMCSFSPLRTLQHCAPSWMKGLSPLMLSLFWDSHELLQLLYFSWVSFDHHLLLFFLTFSWLNFNSCLATEGPLHIFSSLKLTSIYLLTAYIPLSKPHPVCKWLLTSYHHPLPSWHSVVCAGQCRGACSKAHQWWTGIEIYFGLLKLG
jgi:hypothetical protein